MICHKKGSVPFFTWWSYSGGIHIGAGKNRDFAPYMLDSAVREIRIPNSKDIILNYLAGHVLGHFWTWKKGLGLAINYFVVWYKKKGGWKYQILWRGVDCLYCWALSFCDSPPHANIFLSAVMSNDPVDRAVATMMKKTGSGFYSSGDTILNYLTSRLLNLEGQVLQYHINVKFIVSCYGGEWWKKGGG